MRCKYVLENGNVIHFWNMVLGVVEFSSRGKQNWIDFGVLTVVITVKSQAVDQSTIQFLGCYWQRRATNWDVLLLPCSSIHQKMSEKRMAWIHFNICKLHIYFTYTANVYRHTTDKLMFISVISTVRWIRK